MLEIFKYNQPMSMAAPDMPWVFSKIVLDIYLDDFEQKNMNILKEDIPIQIKYTSKLSLNLETIQHKYQLEFVKYMNYNLQDKKGIQTCLPYQKSEISRPSLNH